LNKQAINQLKSFINSVESSVKNGKMSGLAGTTLINAANAILALL
jgi:FIMAH domain